MGGIELGRGVVQLLPGGHELVALGVEVGELSLEARDDLSDAGIDLGGHGLGLLGPCLGLGCGLGLLGELGELRLKRGALLGVALGGGVESRDGLFDLRAVLRELLGNGVLDLLLGGLELAVARPAGLLYAGLDLRDTACELRLV